MSEQQRTATTWRCWVHGGKAENTEDACDRKEIAGYRHIDCAYVPASDSGSEATP